MNKYTIMYIVCIIICAYVYVDGMGIMCVCHSTELGLIYNYKLLRFTIICNIEWTAREREREREREEGREGGRERGRGREERKRERKGVDSQFPVDPFGVKLLAADENASSSSIKLRDRLPVLSWGSPLLPPQHKKNNTVTISIT